MAGYKGLIIEPDKTIREVTFGGLTDLQAGVKGYIEPVDLTGGVTMFVNEEFLLGAFGPDDVNWIAGDVCGLGGRPEFMFRPILGPVVMVGSNHETGETIDLPEVGMRWVKRVGREAGARWTTEARGTCSHCGATLVNEDCPNYGDGAEHAEARS